MTKTTVSFLNQDVGVLKHVQSQFTTEKLGYKLPIPKLLLACALYVSKKIVKGEVKLEYVNGKVNLK